MRNESINSVIKLWILKLNYNKYSDNITLYLISYCIPILSSFVCKISFLNKDLKYVYGIKIISRQL